VIRVRVGEKQVELARSKLGRQLRLLFLDLLRKLGIARRELVELDEVASAFLQLLPGPDELPVLGRLSPECPRLTRVIPDAGLR
jgi:hypothetical protein